MRTTEAFVEFLVPGLLLCLPLSLILAAAVGASPVHQLGLTLNLPAGFQAPVVLFAFFAGAYVSGIVLSELGTASVKRKSGRVVLDCILRHQAAIELYGYESLRGVRLDQLSADRAWDEFSYLRAYARTKSPAADVRVGSHGSVLRVLRPCLVGVPLFIVLWGGVLITHTTWPPWRVGISFMASAFAAVPIMRLAYFQRLDTAVKSSIQHFLALNAPLPPGQKHV